MPCVIQFDRSLTIGQVNDSVNVQVPANSTSSFDVDVQVDRRKPTQMQTRHSHGTDQKRWNCIELRHRHLTRYGRTFSDTLVRTAPILIQSN